MPVVNHSAQQAYSRQQGANRVRIVTWGIATSVSAPGNATGNTPVADPNDPGFPVLTPTHLKTTDTCDPVFLPALADKSIQVTGTAGAGGSIAIEGSHDGVNYVGAPGRFWP